MATITCYTAPSTYITLDISDKTKLFQKLMGDDYIQLAENYTSVRTISIGDYVKYDGTTYYVNAQPEVKKTGRMFEHKVIFEGLRYELTRVQFLDSDGQSDFYLTGDLDDFLDLIITNMNRALTGWAKGTVDNSNKTDYHNLHFQGESCMAVLQRLTELYDGEFNIDSRSIDFTDKVGSASGLSFSYGKDNGLRSIERQSPSNQAIVTRVYAYGSERNLDIGYRSGQRRLRRNL